MDKPPRLTPAVVDGELELASFAGEVETPIPDECRPFIEELGLDIGTRFTTPLTKNAIFEVIGFETRGGVALIKIIPVTNGDSNAFDVTLEDMRLRCEKGSINIQ